MAIQGVIYQNQKVSAEDHAALFQMFISDGIISGCGVSKLRNVLTISSGMFVLAGRLSKIIGSEQIIIPDTIRSTTARLTGVIDLGQIASKTEFHQFSFRLDVANNGTYQALRKENINTGNGQYYEAEWAILTVDGDGNITNVDVKIGNSEGTAPTGGNKLTVDDFNYETGNYLFETSGDDWELAFLSSGSFKLEKTLSNLEIFIIGAGFNGTHKGGDSGYFKTVTQPKLLAGEYDVIIGESNGAVSSIGDIAVSSEDPKRSGGAAAVPNAGTAGKNGTPGEYAFDSATSLISSLSGRKYGATGGGGAARGYNGTTATYAAGGSGADYGSGAGGTLDINSINGGNALPNSGSGGGGASSNIWDSSLNNSRDGKPGKGGSGIIIIRPARAAS